MLNIFLDQTSFDQVYKAVGTVGALGTFLWTVYTWREKSRRELEASAADAQRASRARIIEATKPFLELQLRLYGDVTETAATIATSSNPSQVQAAIQHFLAMFSGSLVLVENQEVATAMLNFHDAIQSDAGRSEPQSEIDETPLDLEEIRKMEKKGLGYLSRELAKACKQSLAKSWHVDAWANPDNAA